MQQGPHAVYRCLMSDQNLKSTQTGTADKAIGAQMYRLASQKRGFEKMEM